ncbi:MAG TPA: hypothetical protein VEC12_12135 [Bacteroidia bacterium]|nr:hypothetical protein [Bacteroidia bacterium]
MKLFQKIPVLIILLAVLASCKRNDYSSWDTNMLTPIASTSLSISDLLTDSTVRSNPDSSLQLVYDYRLYTIKTSDFFHVPDTEVKATLTLEKLKLADRTLSQSITLEDIYPQAAFAHGSQATIPAQNITSVPPTPIDGSSFFNTAVLKEGYIDITIANGFPVDVQEVDFRLVNKVTGDILVSDKMTDIASGSSKTATANLAGKQVDASMEVRVVSLKTYASPGPVTINKNDKVDITITVRDLKPQSATAKFPSQSVYSKDENSLYNFNGAEIKKLKIKKGVLRLRIVSTIQEDMTVVYSIPHAVKNGNSVNETLRVPASAPGKNQDVFKDIPLDGYLIDLRGKNPVVDDTVNAFYNTLNVTIDSSGRTASISLSDSVYIYYGLLDMEPEWAEGYFGQQVIEAGPTTEPFNFFSGSSGKITFDDMNLTLKITNGIGADAEVDIKNITSSNSRSGNKVTLTATPLSAPINMARATDNPFTEKITSYLLTNSNSNVKPFVENMPDALDYHMVVKTNPSGNVSNWKDFIYDKSELKADLNATMPLSLLADNLVLMDTLPFAMFASGNLNRVKQGTFNLSITNSFPFSAILQLYIIDESGAVVDSLVGLQNNFVQASGYNTATNQVTNPSQSVVKAFFSRDRMDKVKAGRRLLVKAIFNTPVGATQPVKIYSHYKFDIKLTGDFVYEQRF